MNTTRAQLLYAHPVLKKKPHKTPHSISRTQPNPSPLPESLPVRTKEPLSPHSGTIPRSKEHHPRRSLESGAQPGSCNRVQAAQDGVRNDSVVAPGITVEKEQVSACWKHQDRVLLLLQLRHVKHLHQQRRYREERSHLLSCKHHTPALTPGVPREFTSPPQTAHAHVY